MERRFLDRERASKIRRAIAVAQLVSQSEDTLVSYWLERYAEGAIKEGGSAQAPGESTEQKDRKAEAPEPVTAAR
jgi:hypothetical protein